MSYYRRRNYRKQNKGPDLFDMLVEIIFFLGVIFGKLIFWIFKKIFSNKNKTKGLFRLNTEPTENSEEFTRIQDKINKIAQSPYAENDNGQELPIPIENTRKYTLKESQITEAETNFLQILKEVVGDKYRIEPQVQLSSIVRPTDSNGRYTNYTDFNKIKAKSIDFVLFDDKNKPCLAIELDDSSHFREDRIKRDEFVNDLMNEVGLRIIRIRASYKYDIERLRKQIFIVK